jgi:hypothetical protein
LTPAQLPHSKEGKITGEKSNFGQLPTLDTPRETIPNFGIESEQL